MIILKTQKDLSLTAEIFRNNTKLMRGEQNDY